MGIIKLRLHQYLVLVSARRADPLKDMASQMLQTLYTGQAGRGVHLR